jgi:hypothetical protein
MSEEFGLKGFERFRIVLPGEASEHFAETTPRVRGRAFAARVSEPVLDEPDGYTWLSRVEQTLVFVKRLYQTRV